MHVLLGRCSRVRGSRPEVDAWLSQSFGGGWSHGPYGQGVDRDAGVSVDANVGEKDDNRRYPDEIMQIGNDKG